MNPMLADAIQKALIGGNHRALLSCAPENNAAIRRDRGTTLNFVRSLKKSSAH
jgi:hypothetical protein